MIKEDIVSELIDYHESYRSKSIYSRFDLMYSTLKESNIFNPSNIFESLGKLSKKQLDMLYTYYILTKEELNEVKSIRRFEDECTILPMFKEA